ncbi:hypothetical protein [Sutcliffiella horikoshii]|uniref:hypothetical protein n=1 Tax=Sutcliffiella horikoshii TaxID=79883 RepID=UPI003CF4E92A
MNCKVLTYNHPRKLEELETFRGYVNCLHICATKNMRDGVFERYQKGSEKPYITAPIITSITFIKALFPSWYSSETKLKQYLTLSEALNNKIAMDSEYYYAFRRNQIEVLDTIRLLELSGIKPDDFDEEWNLSDKEKIFIKLWRGIENHVDFRQIRRTFSSQIQIHEEKLKESLFSLIEQEYGVEDRELINRRISFDTLVLHGFYFLTSEQQRIFQLLKKAGVNIIFLNLYDERYPGTFSFISDFISKSHGWIDMDAWEIGGSYLGDTTIADKFLSDYEGISVDGYSKQEMLVTDYEDFYSFLSEFEDSQSGEGMKKTFIAPNAQALNERLLEYYPELFKKKRRFLSYPIGQFMFHLHQMWDERKKCLKITEGGIFACFSSGWLYDMEKDENARDFSKELRDLLPFFKGCETIDEWMERAALLNDIQKEALSSFDMGNDNRFDKMMDSPFRRISHFSLEEQEVTQVLRFIKQLFDVAGALFGNGENRISLTEHFKKLRHLVFDSNPHLEKEIQQEERTLIEELKQTLQAAPTVEMFHIDDISTAISLYLSGNLEGDPNKDMIIRPFIEMDGEAFKDNKITHVTGLDENSLPYNEYQLPWPLQERTFRSLAERNIPLSFQSLRNRHVKGITRYLMYNLFQFSNAIELSWMVQYEDKNNLDKAIYLDQLGLVPNKENDSLEEDSLDEPLIRSVSKGELDSFLAYPIDALAEFEFCPRRFYYSYITEEYSSFDSEFIHEFMYGNLLKSVQALIGRQGTEEMVKKEVDKLFPYWTDFKRNLMADENLRYSHWARKHYGGHIPYGKENEYSDLRKLFLFPALQNQHGDDDSKKTANRIQDLYDKPETIIPDLRGKFEYQLNNHPIQMEAKPSMKCRFCPHNAFCPEAYHPVDDEERRKSS